MLGEGGLKSSQRAEGRAERSEGKAHSETPDSGIPEFQPSPNSAPSCSSSLPASTLTKDHASTLTLLSWPVPQSLTIKLTLQFPSVPFDPTPTPLCLSHNVLLLLYLPSQAAAIYENSAWYVSSIFSHSSAPCCWTSNADLLLLARSQT